MSPHITKSTSIAERRRLPRIAAEGTVEILFDDPLPVTVHAELVDVSDSGLRASHDSKRLVPGLIVRLNRNAESRRARVIWTHVQDGRRLSGFLLL